MSSTCRTIPPKQRGKAASDGKVPVQGDEAPTKKRRRSSAAPGAELTAIHRQVSVTAGNMHCNMPSRGVCVIKHVHGGFRVSRRNHRLLPGQCPKVQ
jgi:hypothetical protein